MTWNEADTRAKLIDPAIHKHGWTEDLIRREETAGTVEIINGKPRRRSRGKVDYVLRVKVNVDTQPVALALIEAKKDTLPAGHGLDQAKGYAECKRLNVKFVFSSNGHQFVEFDYFTGLTSAPRPMAEFPTPAELRALRKKHGLRSRVSIRPAAPAAIRRRRRDAALLPGCGDPRGHGEDRRVRHRKAAQARVALPGHRFRQDFHRRKPA
jgi:type I restriction enzyme R subunit